MKENIKNVYGSAVKRQVAANNHASWGQDDSVAVIEALADEAYGSGEGMDCIRELVRELVNPSAFRQKLEKLPETASCHVRKAEKGKRGAGAGMGALEEL